MTLRAGRWVGLALLVAGCMRVSVQPETKQVTAWILGNGHATVCEQGGVTTRERSALGAPQGETTPVATEVPDVSVRGRCVEVTGSSTSSNLVIAIGLVAAALAAVGWLA